MSKTSTIFLLLVPFVAGTSRYDETAYDVQEHEELPLRPTLEELTDESALTTLHKNPYLSLLEHYAAPPVPFGSDDGYTNFIEMSVFQRDATDSSDDSEDINFEFVPRVTSVNSKGFTINHKYQWFNATRKFESISKFDTSFNSLDEIAVEHFSADVAHVVVMERRFVDEYIMFQPSTGKTIKVSRDFDTVQELPQLIFEVNAFSGRKGCAAYGQNLIVHDAVAEGQVAWLDAETDEWNPLPTLPRALTTPGARTEARIYVNTEQQLIAVLYSEFSEHRTGKADVNDFEQDVDEYVLTPDGEWAANHLGKQVPENYLPLEVVPEISVFGAQ